MFQPPGQVPGEQPGGEQPGGEPDGHRGSGTSWEQSCDPVPLEHGTIGSHPPTRVLSLRHLRRLSPLPRASAQRRPSRKAWLVRGPGPGSLALSISEPGREPGTLSSDRSTPSLLHCLDRTLPLTQAHCTEQGWGAGHSPC